MVDVVDKAPDFDKLDRKHARQQRESLAQTEEALGPVLANPAGIRRLLAITDEEWEEAQAKDEQVAGGESGT